ncbi:hypothetical protein [Flindersiella endophytica]
MTTQPTSLSSYASRKQRILDKISALQSQMYLAGNEVLGWSFRNELLELVERLPKRDQAAWRQEHLEQLNTVAGPPPGLVPPQSDGSV